MKSINDQTSAEQACMKSITEILGPYFHIAREPRQTCLILRRENLEDSVLIKTKPGPLFERELAAFTKGLLIAQNHQTEPFQQGHES